MPKRINIIGAADPAELRRLAQKVDNARGFARNDKQTLSVGAAPSPSAKPSSSSATEVALLKITGNATGKGWYEANTWELPSTPPDPTSDLTEGVLGQAGVACYFANLAEAGASTHDLTDAANTKQKLFIGLRRGSTAAGDPIYVNTGIWLEDC